MFNIRRTSVKFFNFCSSFVCNLSQLWMTPLDQLWSDYISESKAKFFWMFLASFVEKWEHKVYNYTVLRIHDILVWIRIRIWIRGSMPLINGPGSRCGSGSCQQKTNLKKNFFAYYFLKLHLHHFQR
jgi:hypothetical protein